MTSTRAATLTALGLSLLLPACSEERGACIVGKTDARPGICIANKTKDNCGAPDEFLPSATPAEAVSKCKAHGFTRPFDSHDRDFTDADVEAKLAAGENVSFGR